MCPSKAELFACSHQLPFRNGVFCIPTVTTNCTVYNSSNPFTEKPRSFRFLGMEGKTLDLERRTGSGTSILYLTCCVTLDKCLRFFGYHLSRWHVFICFCVCVCVCVWERERERERGERVRERELYDIVKVDSNFWGFSLSWHLWEELWHQMSPSLSFSICEKGMITGPTSKV